MNRFFLIELLYQLIMVQHLNYFKFMKENEFIK